MKSRRTGAEGEELAQETQQLEGHEALREGRSRKQNLQQAHTQPAQELLHTTSLLVISKEEKKTVCSAVFMSVVHLVLM